MKRTQKRLCLLAAMAAVGSLSLPAMAFTLPPSSSDMTIEVDIASGDLSLVGNGTQMQGYSVFSSTDAGLVIPAGYEGPVQKQFPMTWESTGATTTGVGEEASSPTSPQIVTAGTWDLGNIYDTSKDATDLVLGWINSSGTYQSSTANPSTTTVQYGIAVNSSNSPVSVSYDTLSMFQNASPAIPVSLQFTGGGTLDLTAGTSTSGIITGINITDTSGTTVNIIDAGGSGNTLTLSGSIVNGTGSSGSGVGNTLVFQNGHFVLSGADFGGVTAGTMQIGGGADTPATLQVGGNNVANGQPKSAVIFQLDNGTLSFAGGSGGAGSPRSNPWTLLSGTGVTNTIDVGNESSQELDGVISGGGGLTVASSTAGGTLILNPQSGGNPAANTYAGTTTIEAGATLELEGDISQLGGGIVDNSALIFELTANTSFSHAISGSGAVTITGAHTLTLGSDANTYSGGTTLEGGVTVDLETTSGPDLGTGPLTLAGATVVNASGTSFSSNTAITVTGSTTNTIDAGGFGTTITWTGTVSSAAAGNTLILQDGGFVDNGSFTGFTAGTIQTGNGTLATAATFTAGPKANGFIGAGATIALDDGTFVNETGIGLGVPNNITISGANNFIDAGGQTLTLSGSVTSSGAGNILVLTDGTFVDNGANFTGVTAGTLQIGGGASTPTTFQVGSGGGQPTSNVLFYLDNGTIDFGDNNSGSGSSLANNWYLFNGTGVTNTINVGTGTVFTLSGVIADKTSGGALTVTSNDGGGELILSGANTYSGTTTIGNGATLRLEGDTSQLGGGIVDNSALIFAPSAEPPAGNTSFSHVISGGGRVVLDAGTTATTLTLSGTNTYTGGTVVSNGKLVAGSDSAFGTGALTVNSGTTLETTGAQAGSGTTLAVNAASYTQQADSTLALLVGSSTSYDSLRLGSGAASLAGTLDLIFASGANPQAGQNYTVIGTTGPVTGNFSAVHLTNAGSLSYTAAYVADTGEVISLVSTPTLYWTGTVGGTAQADNNGNWDTSSGNTLWSTAQTGGTAQVWANGDIASFGAGGTSAVTVTIDQAGVTAAGITFNAMGTGGSYTIAASGGGSLVLNGAVTMNASATISAPIIGGSVLTVAGPDTLTLEGVNTYTGATAVNSGTLALAYNSGTSTDGSIADSSGVTVGGGATFDISRINAAGTSITSLAGGGTVTLGAKNLTLTDASGTFSGIIQNGASGNGGVVLNSGAETLSGANTYTGATTLSAGTLALSGAGGVADSSGVVLSSGATFDISQVTTGATILGLTGPGGTVALGGETLTVNVASGANTFGGVIQDGGIGSGTGGGLTLSGAGTLTLTGANTYTGTTTISAGTLALGSGGSIADSSVALSSGGTLDISQTTSGATIPGLTGTGGTVALGGKALTINIASGSDTFGGAIQDGGIGSGAGGSLVLGGNGTLILSGANTYTGTTTISGGTLEFTASTAELTGNVTDNTALIFAQAASSGLSGAISGSGGVAENGAADTTLTFSVTETYTGATSVASGTLALSGAGSIADSSGVALSGGAAFDISQTTSGATILGLTGAGGTVALGGKALTINISSGANTFAGVVQDGGIGSGTGGSLILSGGGTLALSSANTYSGGTTLTNASVVQVGQSSSLGSGGVTIKGDGGGTIQFGAASLNVANNLTLSSSGTIDANGFGGVAAETYSGAITGGGGLTVASSRPGGELILPNANSYVGGTTIDSGAAIDVGNSSALGTGDVILNSGAVLASINAVPANINNSTGIAINVGGNYTMGANSTLVLAIAGPSTDTGSYDTLNVAGTANLPNGNLLVQFNHGYSPAALDKYTVVTAASVTGPFANARSTDPLYTLTQTATSTTDTIEVLPIKPELTEEAAADMGNTSVETGIFTSETIFQEIGDIFNGVTGFNASGLSLLHTPDADPFTTALNAAMKSTSQQARDSVRDLDVFNPGVAAGGGAVPVPSSESRKNTLSGFVTGDIIVADTGEVAHYTTGGVIAGVDYNLASHLVVGAMFAYNYTGAKLDNIGSALRDNAYSPGVYFGVRKSHFYLNGLASYTYNDYRLHRNVTAATASSSPYGHQFDLDALAGYNFHFFRGFKAGPAVGLGYTHLNVSGYTETGAPAQDLTIAPMSVDSLRSLLGAQLAYAWRLRPTAPAVNFTGNAFWQHEYLNGSRAINAFFPGGVPFAISTPAPERDSALLGAGVSGNLAKNMTLFLNYEAQVGQEHQMAQSVMAGVAIALK